MNILILFFALTALARDCAVYELRGSVAKKNDVILTINEGSNSQKVFRFNQKTELAMAPFIGKFVVGKFTLEDMVITKVEYPDLAIPDPLLHKKSQTFLMNTECADKKKGQPKLPSSTKK